MVIPISNYQLPNVIQIVTSLASMKACHVKTRSVIGAAVVIAVIVLFAAHQRSNDGGGGAAVKSKDEEVHVWRGGVGGGGGAAFLHGTGVDVAKAPPSQPPATPLPPPHASSFTQIPCRINDVVVANVGYKDNSAASSPDEALPRGAAARKPVKCISSQVNDETYIPFTFIEKYFGVSMKIAIAWFCALQQSSSLQILGEQKTFRNGTSYFEWSHSQSKVFPRLKGERYNFRGTFMQFANFNVETRHRVKCVTAIDGVPISTQWDKNGYYYSTQIGQFALSHWSKNILKAATPSSPPTVLENGDSVEGKWRGDVTRVLTDKCVHFDLSSPIYLDFPAPSSTGASAFVLHFDLQYKQNVTVSVSIKSPNKDYVIKFVADDTYVRREGRELIFGYGSGLAEGEWKPFTRHLLQDVQKAVPKSAYQAFTKNITSIRISQLRFDGVGCVTNVSLAESEHLRFFLSGADWFLRNQDGAGGWPMKIVFNKGWAKYPGAGELPEGWYGAMAQGHAMSVLSRAWIATNNTKYSDAAIKALDLFSIPSQEGGIVAWFLDTLKWYEEYPTTPGSFVLNGFMYSLIGLHDVMDMLEEMGRRPKELEAATQLWRDGMKSLLTLLPLFDTGSGTVYDLRHFSMRGSAPKLARWDYHSTHINQLYLLSTVAERAVDRELILATAERWRSYMVGDTAEHN